MRKFSFFLVLVFSNLLLFSQINIDSITNNNAYKPGEKLVYDIRYGAIKGGEASLTIDIIPSGEDFYYYVKAKAVTTGVATKFARIYDVYESYFSISNGYPVKSIRNIRENNYMSYNEVLFYRNKNYVYSINTGKHWIPKNALDILSAFYFARRHVFHNHLSKNQTINLPIYFEDKLYQIKLKFKEKDVIRSKFGRIECLKFVPLVDINNPFKKEDDMQIWFSDDGNFIPIKIKMKSKIGTVKAKLIGYDNLKNPLGVK
ncbi:MAG: DUF3108 domain-containing protein [Bacteroidota bacterium]|nr:DUF3108 domain-containing protein [Bacteroidota bacterium]